MLYFSAFEFLSFVNRKLNYKIYDHTTIHVDLFHLSLTRSARYKIGTLFVAILKFLTHKSSYVHVRWNLCSIFNLVETISASMWCDLVVGMKLIQLNPHSACHHQCSSLSTWQKRSHVQKSSAKAWCLKFHLEFQWVY